MLVESITPRREEPEGMQTREERVGVYAGRPGRIGLDFASSGAASRAFGICSALWSDPNRTVVRLAPPMALCYSFGSLRSRWSVSRSQRPCSALTVPSPSQNRFEVNGAR